MKQRGMIYQGTSVSFSEKQNKTGMRKRMKRSLEWLHVLLVFSMVTPLIYMANTKIDMEQIYPMYFAGYLLILPIIGLLTAQRVCKNFIQYFAVCLCIGFVVKISAQKLGQILLNEGVGVMYAVCMVMCTIVIAVGAFATRMYKIRRKEARENQDSTWTEDGFQLDKPGKAYCVLFVLIYVIGLFRSCSQICNLALCSTLAYLLVTISYEYMNAVEEYLKRNENMCQVRNIPYKRIYGIGKLFFIGYLFLLFLTLLPALLTVDKREYIVFKTTEYQKEIATEDLDIYIQPPMEVMVDPMLEEIDIEPIIPPQILPFLDVLVYIIGVVTLVSILFVVIVVIKKELAEFAKASEEEEDVVESLEPVEEDEIVFLQKRPWKRSEDDKIRRLYRKFIRKHRKELPAIYETPIEIETAAGVADTEEGKALHEKYEQVRYGN